MARDVEETFYIAARNDTELRFAKELQRKGYHIIQRGWPDFVVFNHKAVPILIEVKRPHDKLSWPQLAVLTLLHDYGFDVRVFVDGKSTNIEGDPLSSTELERGHLILSGKGNYGLQGRLAPTSTTGVPALDRTIASQAHRQSSGGYIRPSGKGSWRLQLSLGKRPDGKYQRYHEMVRGTKGDATRRMNELLRLKDNMRGMVDIKHQPWG